MAKTAMSIEIESLSSDPSHFETHHENGETFLCMQHNGQCSIMVEIIGSSENQELLVKSTETALMRLDKFFDNNLAELFPGLHIKFSKLEGGGQAFPEENLIELDVNKMSMSLQEAENYGVEHGWLNAGDWTKVMNLDEVKIAGSCLVYNLVHEFGHLIDTRSTDGSLEGLNVEDSPTKYGSEKRNEALAEAFTYKVFGLEISPHADNVIENRIQELKISIGK